MRVDPPGTIVWTSDPTSAARLLASEGYRRELVDQELPIAYEFASWRSYAWLYRGQMLTDALFCHMRQAPGCQPRLVALNDLHYPCSSGAFRGGGFVTSVVAPGGLFGRPRVCSSGDVMYLAMKFPDGAAVELYAGAADPIDSARFTVPYSINGARGEIEGVLLPDDWVRMRVISGPGMMPIERYEKAEAQALEIRKQLRLPGR